MSNVCAVIISTCHALSIDKIIPFLSNILMQSEYLVSIGKGV